MAWQAKCLVVLILDFLKNEWAGPSTIIFCHKNDPFVHNNLALALVCFISLVELLQKSMHIFISLFS